MAPGMLVSPPKMQAAKPLRPAVPPMAGYTVL